jgi:ion channel
MEQMRAPGPALVAPADGDLVPTTDVAKLFTVFYVLTGIGILVSFFTTLTGKVLALQAERRRERGTIE